jgi:hypothetical protein
MSSVSHPIPCMSVIDLSGAPFIKKFDYKASHINYVTFSICKNSVTQGKGFGKPQF